MNPAVAVHAAARQQEPVRLARRKTGRAEGDTGMPGRRMTLLAKQWRPVDQQIGIHRTMRLMAIQAVFLDRRMLPQERTPLRRMALVTGLVDRVLFQQHRTEGTVRIVAGATGQLRRGHRMMGELREISPYGLVAAVTYLRLGRSFQSRIVFGVDRMATDAGQSLALMNAAMPRHSLGILVACEANGIFLRHTRRGIGREERNRRALLTLGRRLDVPSSRPMAGFALVACKRRPRIGHHGVFGVEDRPDLGRVMTEQTGVRPRSGVAGWRRWWVGPGCGGLWRLRPSGYGSHGAKDQ